MCRYRCWILSCIQPGLCSRAAHFCSQLVRLLSTSSLSFTHTCIVAIVLAVAARSHPKRELYSILMQEAKVLCGMVLVEFWKSVEIVQAFILLAVFPAPSRRWDEDKTWMYLGCAIRLAADLDLNRRMEGPFASEMAEREYLNRTRTWLICHNLE